MCELLQLLKWTGDGLGGLHAAEAAVVVVVIVQLGDESPAKRTAAA
jgi:hypothetical protein